MTEAPAQSGKPTSLGGTIQFERSDQRNGEAWAGGAAEHRCCLSRVFETAIVGIGIEVGSVNLCLHSQVAVEHVADVGIRRDTTLHVSSKIWIGGLRPAEVQADEGPFCSSGRQCKSQRQEQESQNRT